MQDDRRHKNVEPVVDDKRMERLLRDPLTSNIKLLREGTRPLAIVERTRTEVKLDKPLLVGIAILEHSKKRMYEFYYDTMKKVFSGDLRLLMTGKETINCVTILSSAQPPF